jgi:hypothetical protein
VAAGAARGLDYDGVTDLVGGAAWIPVSRERPRLRMTHTHAGEPMRETSLVGGATDGIYARAEQRRSLPLHSRREPLEASIRLGCDQPHGVGAVDQLVEGPLARAIPDGQRHDVDAARQIVTDTCIGGRHDLVAADRVQIRDECGPHR